MKYTKQLMIAAVVVAIAGAGAFVALRGKQPAGAGGTGGGGGTSAVAGPVPEVIPELRLLLANYRKIIVLLADEKTLSEADRKAAGQVGQSLFHENLERQAGCRPCWRKPRRCRSAAARRGRRCAAVVHRVGKRPVRRRPPGVSRSAARCKRWRRIQTLPAIKLHKRISEDLDALQDIERNYDKEIRLVFGRFEPRAIELKRERWEDYVAPRSCTRASRS
jgi:hypothetical protein